MLLREVSTKPGHSLPLLSRELLLSPPFSFLPSCLPYPSQLESFGVADFLHKLYYSLQCNGATPTKTFPFKNKNYSFHGGTLQQNFLPTIISMPPLFFLLLRFPSFVSRLPSSEVAQEVTSLASHRSARVFSPIEGLRP